MDLDDTLFLERDYVRSGFDAVGQWARRRFQVENFASRAFHEFEVGCRGDIFNLVLSACGCPAAAEDIEAMIAVYRQHFPNISLLADARQFLSAAHQRCHIAVVTDGPLCSQQQKFRALGLGAFVELAVFTGAWPREYWKPHQRGFRLVQRVFRSPDMRYCYIGDNPAKDFLAPRSLGWGTVRVRRDGALHSRQHCSEEQRAEVEVADLAALIPILEERFHVLCDPDEVSACATVTTSCVTSA